MGKLLDELMNRLVMKLQNYFIECLKQANIFSKTSKSFEHERHKETFANLINFSGTEIEKQKGLAENDKCIPKHRFIKTKVYIT